MKTENKTHYRKVFKSDHLGRADVEEFIEEGKSLIFTIEKVIQYELIEGNDRSGVVVAGKRIGANIAFFKESIKPMVINAGNSDIMAAMMNSKFVEDWKNVTVEIAIDPSKRFKGKVVGGLVIKSKPISWEPVEQLFEVKKESLSDEIQANAERIIKERETASYTKLYTYLKSL
jgi:hypothetical protein